MQEPVLYLNFKSVFGLVGYHNHIAVSQMYSTESVLSVNKIKRYNYLLSIKHWSSIHVGGTGLICALIMTAESRVCF